MKSLVLAILLCSTSSFGATPCSEGATRTAPSTGAVFTCDTSKKFANAFRDPNGLIWTDLAHNGSGYLIATRNARAAELCQQNGFRLPNDSDFESLRTFLGKYSAAGYNRLGSDGQKLLPFLEAFQDYTLWSSDVDPSYSNLRHTFQASNGFIDILPADFSNLFVCVTK